jgi:hypothetical protein
MAGLPDAPRGRELEDYFAALLQSTGHYVEKNIEKPNILELDIVATDYRAGEARSRLFEVKGTEPRLEDIFKLVGRMTYLGLGEGAFVTTKESRERASESFDGVCQTTNVQFIPVPDLDNARSVFHEHGFGEADELPHAIWRYSYWVERLYVDAVRKLRRTYPSAETASAYYGLINSGVFLTPDHVDKVARIYDAYGEHPRLTLDLASEMAPQGKTGDDVLKEALFKGAHVCLHATMYFEHRARLSLLKAASDYLLAGGPVKADDRLHIKVDFRVASLPQTFLDGLDWLKRQPNYWLFPLLWQNFLWGWGGLLPDDARSSTLADLAEASGLSVDDAEVALQAFDELFPIESGWLRRLSTAAYQYVLLTPWHFQGLGAFHQLLRAGHKKYEEWDLSGRYTRHDFASRHNALVKLLEGAGGTRR